MKRYIAWLLAAVLLLSLVPFASASREMTGDLNGDSSVDMRDLLMLRRWFAGGYGVVLDEEDADLDHDGSATVISSISICSGVLPSRRASCVSVAILVGIRLSTRMRSGRMSWLLARSVSMTKMFSSCRVLAAGRSGGIQMGMRSAPYI